MRPLDFFFSARPLLHLPIWSIYLVTLHYHHDLSGEEFDRGDLLTLCALSLMAAGAYWLNQVYDYDSDELNGKLGFLQRRFLTQRQMIWGAVAATCIALPLAFIQSTFLFGIFLQGAAFSYLYSAPPFRLKDRPIAGIFANAITFGFLVSVTVVPQMNSHTIGLVGWDTPPYFFLAVAAIHLMTTLPDLSGDRFTGKRTFAVAWGRTPLLIVAALLMLGAVWVAQASGYGALVAIALISAILILSNLLVHSRRLELAAAKLPILLLTLFAAYFYPYYLLFIIALICATRIYYRKRFDMVYPQIA